MDVRRHACERGVAVHRGASTARADSFVVRRLDGRNGHQTIDTTHIAGYAGGAVIGDLRARLGFDYAWTRRRDRHGQG
jgi:hypothetical protein